MRVLVQRVISATVTINDKLKAKINKGYLVMVGVHKDDTQTHVNKMVQKLLNLRIMSDKNGKMNLSIRDTKGELLIVSQFTLYADTASRRPGFSNAAEPDKVRVLYDNLLLNLEKSGLTVQRGTFGAYMQVRLINDGPVTILLES